MYVGRRVMLGNWLDSRKLWMRLRSMCLSSRMGRRVLGLVQCTLWWVVVFLYISMVFWFRLLDFSTTSDDCQYTIVNTIGLKVLIRYQLVITCTLLSLRAIALDGICESNLFLIMIIFVAKWFEYSSIPCHYSLLLTFSFYCQWLTPSVGHW